MEVVILDEDFYLEEIFYSEKDYIDELLDFVKNYINAEIAMFVPDSNISDIWSRRNHITALNREIQKRGNFKIYDQKLVIPSEDQELSVFSPNFIGRVHLLHEEAEKIIILFPINKHNQDVKQISSYLFVINNFNEELNSNFSNWVGDGLLVKNILTPTLDSPLPNTDLVKKYKKLLDKKLKNKNINERIPVILEICGEVLRRNKYKYDQVVSSVNSTDKKIRTIYKSNSTPVIYGCIDVDTGSIEICYCNGQHKDEYGFDNSPHNKHDKTGRHDIKVHK